MPTITAAADPLRPYILVNIDWSDIPTVQYARVVRINTITGEEAPLRPYICFDGDCILLSCGFATFWDTELPLDTPVLYRTEACPAYPECELLDTFERTVVAGWGSADTGQAWTNTGGAAADYNVNTGTGQHLHTAANVAHVSRILGIDNQIDAAVTVTVNAIALTSPYRTSLAIRDLDANNQLRGELVFNTNGTVTAQIVQVLGGITTVAASIPSLTTYIAGSSFRLRMQAEATVIQFKAWDALTDEPTAWTLNATDSSTLLPNTGISLRSIRDTGNTNLNFPFAFDDLTACGSCDLVEPTTAETVATVSQDSDGSFWLKDPVRPYHDLPVPLCFTSPHSELDGSMCLPNAGTLCVPAPGIFFASMDTEQFAANSQLNNPTNAKYPLSVHRTRRAPASTLTLVTRTFDDRDSLRDLNEPGSPLLLQGPAAYGIADRYMAVGEVSEARGLSDHKFQVRVVTLPHNEVARPAGPSQGVCGSRVADLCNEYETWDDIEAAGLTWTDLLEGEAGGVGT